MVTYQAIRQAYERINHLVVKTPLLTSDRLNDHLGFRLFVKAEPLQRIGAFKFRGACNALLSLPETEKNIIAFSSGNHAQAIALVSRLTGRHATIIMPEDAPKAKIEATRSYGAEVILYNRYTESREDLGDRLKKERNAILVKPYDDEAVICGQGTIGIEIADQIKEQNIMPERVYCCAGGGGLVSGLAVALHETHPDLAIYSAEPDGFDDIARSLEAGEICTNDPNLRSICDAIVTPAPGEITFPIMRQHLAGGASVSDEACLLAMQTAWRHLKLVVEPGGAVALAAALSLHGQPELASKDIASKDIAGKDIIVIASGGNVDDALFERALAMKGAL